MSSASSSSQKGDEPVIEEVTNDDLVASRRTLAQMSSGRDVNQDSWMSVWCSSSWGEYLQPAPLSISILGSILVLASSHSDFSLIVPGATTQRVWKYASHPDSFKTCLQQMVGEGYTAFETAHKNMERIRNLSSQMPEVIQTCVNLALVGTPSEFRSHFQNNVDDLRELVQKCETAAKETESTFHRLSGLAQEMVEACTYKAGSTEKAIIDNERDLDILAVHRAEEEAVTKNLKEATAMAKKMYENAEQDFRTAIQTMPGGWNLVGMTAVESLVGVVAGAGNAVVSIATDVTSVPVSWLKRPGYDDGKGKGRETQPTPVKVVEVPVSNPQQEARTDPAILQAPLVLGYANDIKAILTGNNGKPDWDRICPKKPEYTPPAYTAIPEPVSDPQTPKKSSFFSKIFGKSPSRKEGSSSRSYAAAAPAPPPPEHKPGDTGVVYLRKSLLLVRSRSIDQHKPFSQQLDTYIGTGIHILDRMTEVGRSAHVGNDKALADLVPEVDRLIAGLQCLSTSCNLILQQPGIPATGPATPATPQAIPSGGRRVAVEDAKFKVNQTQIMLETRQKEFEKYSERMIQQQEAVLRTISEMTKLTLTTQGLKDVLPVLREAVATFTTLRARFSQLSRFFESVSSLLKDVMVPSVDRWSKTLTANERDSIAGITMGAFTRDLIYRQMMTPLKISMLTERISTTYVDVSNRYIMPAQMQVGSLLQFTDGKETQEQFLARLRSSQLRLEQDTKQASREIRRLVEADQKTFSTSIENRLRAIKSSIATGAPMLDAPVPEDVKKVAEAHIEEVEAVRAEEAEANPIFNHSLAM